MFAALALASCACDSDSDNESGGPSTGGAGGTGGTTAGGNDTGGSNTGGTKASAGGDGAGAATTGGAPAGGASAGGNVGGAGGGTGGGGPAGTPHVFVGSTDGFVRVFTMSESDGALTAAGALDTGDGLDFIAVGPDDRTVFVSYNQRVAAFAYDPDAKTLTPVDDATTFGAGTHVAVDPTGRFVFVAHYNQGALSFLSYSAQEGFGTAQRFTPGANAHQVKLDAAGTRVFVPCLGDDIVAQYVLDPEGGTLTAATPATTPAGNGPRHMDFHPSAPVAYVLNELASTVQVLDVGANGLLTLRPDDVVFLSVDQRGHQSSDIHVTPDGAFVYAVNRQPSEIVTLRVEDEHTLTRLGAAGLSGVVRSFGVDPSGKLLQVGGSDGRLVAFRIDPATGALTESSVQTGLGNVHATVIRYLEP